MKHWAADLIGLPWRPERNCWWLVRTVIQRRLGLVMPELGIGDLRAADSVGEIMRAASVGGWRPASGPAREFDIVLGDDLTGKRHVGVMVQFKEGLQMLHSDGYMSDAGPVGSISRQPLSEVQLTEIELWRRA